MAAIGLNRESERIPRRLRRGQRANPKKTAFLTVEDSLQLAAGIFNFLTINTFADILKMVEVVS